VKGSIRDVVKVGEGIRDIELSDRKMLHDERIAESVIIGATSSLEIECPLLDTALRTILTECHIVSSTRLVETQSLYEFFLIYGIRNLEGIVFCRRDDRFWVAEIDGVTIWDIGIVGSHSYGDEGAGIGREVGTTFYLGVCGGDVGEGEHTMKN
jgi:hypothetical protein